MAWTIRPATSDDALLVVEFNCKLAEESEGKTLDPTLIGPGVAAALADPNKALYFFAVDDAGVVAGQMMITYEWSDWRNGWFWWIQSVYVRPEARRQGVFRALFEHVQDQAQNTPDIIGLRLYVDDDNVRAHQTYNRMGLEKTTYFLMEQYPLPD